MNCLFFCITFICASIVLLAPVGCKCKGQRIIFPTEKIKQPEIEVRLFRCGYQGFLGTYAGTYNDKSYPIYYMNTTAELLKEKGFNITIGGMFHDAIYNFSYTNGSYESSMGFESIIGTVIGGLPASRVRAYYMAQIGFRSEKNGRITWLCDGVLINDQWVLSAAHCFVTPGVDPNVVRLGEYDLSVDEDTLDPFGKFVYDYPIKEVIFHPGFKLGERYDDLVLIPLPQKYPIHSMRISPICLPWDTESNRNLVGTPVVLTGWGATKYGGDKTTLLQMVEMKVFHVSACNASYSQLPSFRKKYPKGMTSGNTLCVGWEEGGKDACGGDSGAPIVYETEDGRWVLAGIVSGGYGCGLKEYPGLYIPINRSKYLRWIEKTAFN